MIMRGFSTFPYISSINSKYNRSHSLSGPPVVIMKKEMTELENKIKLLKLKIAKTIVSRGGWLGKPANFKGACLC